MPSIVLLVLVLIVAIVTLVRVWRTPPRIHYAAPEPRQTVEPHGRRLCQVRTVHGHTYHSLCVEHPSWREDMHVGPGEVIKESSHWIDAPHPTSVART